MQNVTIIFNNKCSINMYSKRVVIPNNDNDKDIITYVYEQVFYI